MRATADVVDVRPFDMQPQHPVDILARYDRFGRAGHNAILISNHRGQNSGRSQRLMRGDNRFHAFAGWGVVQHIPATAVHLQINKAGRQNAVYSHRPLGHRVRQVGDMSILHAHGLPCGQRSAVEYERWGNPEVH